MSASNKELEHQISTLTERVFAVERENHRLSQRIWNHVLGEARERMAELRAAPSVRETGAVRRCHKCGRDYSMRCSDHERMYHPHDSLTADPICRCCNLPWSDHVYPITPTVQVPVNELRILRQWYHWGTETDHHLALIPKERL